MWGRTSCLHLHRIQRQPVYQINCSLVVRGPFEIAILLRQSRDNLKVLLEESPGYILILLLHSIDKRTCLFQPYLMGWFKEAGDHLTQSYLCMSPWDQQYLKHESEGKRSYMPDDKLAALMHFTGASFCIIKNCNLQPTLWVREICQGRGAGRVPFGSLGGGVPFRTGGHAGLWEPVCNLKTSTCGLGMFHLCCLH